MLADWNASHAFVALFGLWNKSTRDERIILAKMIVLTQRARALVSLPKGWDAP